MRPDTQVWVYFGIGFWISLVRWGQKRYRDGVLQTRSYCYPWILVPLWPLKLIEWFCIWLGRGAEALGARKRARLQELKELEDERVRLYQQHKHELGVP